MPAKLITRLMPLIFRNAIVVISPVQNSSPLSTRVPFAVQFLAWILGLIACVFGMMNGIAEWDPGLATVQFLVLVVAPVVWMIERRRPLRVAAVELSPRANLRRAWLFAVLTGLTSWMTCFLLGQDMVDLPPAYHDEYSYVFQAKTLLLGRFSVPSHPTHSELFDQMHVLNEGRMASRYYPGTGFWLAPWILLGHPYWGYWLASSLASVFVFWTGYELGRLRVGIVSGFACALSPGIAYFSNLLLAHQPTLFGLSLFVWAFVKWQRTRALREAFIAGCGLSFAMLCRPATAAGIGLPFGIAFLYWLLLARDSGQPISTRIRLRSLVAMGLPLVIGWSVMLAYHRDVTGSWKTSPYQLYTDIYSPRHVFGFNNVTRGEQKLGPKVIQAYDQWAKNLTPELAIQNFRDRWVSSWTWTFDVLPLLISSVVAVGMMFRCDRRWTLIGLAILSLHAMHVPYWYTGIMGWHYVFESAPLWCLLLGLATDLLFRDWQQSGRWLMPSWWSLLLIISLAGDYLPLKSYGVVPSGIPRISNALASIRYPRRKYAEFNRWLDANVMDRPAIVLIEIDPDDQHMDYVVNSPGLSDEILRARHHRGLTEMKAIAAEFPDRSIYYCDPKLKLFERIDPAAVR